MDPAAIEDRLQGLKELLPRLLADQPPGSPAAAMLQVMATALVELEAAIDRTLHDHWLALANGETNADTALAILLRLAPNQEMSPSSPALLHGAKAIEKAIRQFSQDTVNSDQLSAVLADLPASDAPPSDRLLQAWRPPLAAYADQLKRGEDPLCCASDGLSRLGALVALHRMRPARADDSIEASQPWAFEAIEAYRRRIQQTVRLLGEGASNPQALLRLAILTVGAQPCGRPMQKLHDTWIAHGVPPELELRGCRDCSQAAGPDSRRCPLAWFEARLIDSPLQQNSLTCSLGGGASCELEVFHQSLGEALPELTITAGTEAAITNPVLENRATGEQLLFAGTIPNEQQLRLQPEVGDAQRLLETSEPIDPYPWRRQFPNGQALLGSAQTDVHSQMWLLSGSRFAGDPDSGTPNTEAARFDAAKFGGITQMQTGDNVLGIGRLGRMRLGPLSATVQVPRLMPGRNLWRYATYDNGSAWSPEELLRQKPADSPPPCTVSLTWWSRPPASFRLELEPLGDPGGAAWMDQAERMGALAELQRWVQRLRPAGVRAEVGFLRPNLLDSQPLDEQPLALSVAHAWRETQSLADAALTLLASGQLAEPHALGDGQPAWGAVLDVCRFDWAYLH